MQSVDEFYAKDFYFSYSGLNKLLFCPSMFFNHYVLGEKEDKVEQYMIEGRLIHCLLLQPHEFDNQFIVAMDKLPSDNVRMIIDRVVREHPDADDLNDVHASIIQFMQEYNYMQTLKTDEQRVAKIITDENVNYFDFARKSKDLTIIDRNTLNKVNEIVVIIKNDTEASDLLKLNLTEFDTGIEVMYELPLQYKLPDYSFTGVKGILDCLVLDHNTKTLTINDFKTTSKSLLDFSESIEYYNYWLQAGIYKLMCKQLLAEKNLDYDIKFNFVVIDKFNQLYCFPVSEVTLKAWTEKTKATLTIADYHYKNRRYNLPYRLDTTKCIL